MDPLYISHLITENIQINNGLLFETPLPESQQELLLIRGLPGSGKSTKAKNYIAQGYEHFEADMYPGLYNYSVEPPAFNPKLLRNAHAWCQEQTKKSLENGKSAVVTNTFTQKWEMAPYIRIAKELNIPIRIEETTYQGKNIHGVPENTLNIMKNKWEQLPPDIDKHPWNKEIPPFEKRR